MRGVGLHILVPPYEGIEYFDDGLRSKLYDKYNYRELLNHFLEYCNEGIIYLASDQFEMNYIIIKHCLNELILIGPYISRRHNELFDIVYKRITLPIARISEIQKFYYGVPYIEGNDTLESEVVLLSKYVLDSDESVVERINLSLCIPEQENIILELSDNRLPMDIIENRYANEDALLEAVEQGDLKQATMYMSMFNKYHLESRHSDSLRNHKNYCFVLNTLLRKAVQKAEVHPAHIHNISSDLAIKIEMVRTESELSKIIPEMIRKYCLLVNNHSLRNYSLPVRKAVNYIDFNYTEHITLEKIAEVASVNYSYLSSQFKKETKMAMVDYVNMKRMQKALTLLASTTLPISAVAEKCGFYDDTYFTRIFKKKHGKSPREYRKSISKLKNL